MITRNLEYIKKLTCNDISLVTASPGESAHPQQNTQVKTIDENERDHILAVLAKTNGKIYGAGGAADLLRIPPTTLGSKIKKLGIKKEFKL